MSRIIILTPPPTRPDPLPIPPPELFLACPHDECYMDEAGNVICTACWGVVEEGV